MRRRNRRKGLTFGKGLLLFIGTFAVLASLGLFIASGFQSPLAYFKDTILTSSSSPSEDHEIEPEEDNVPPEKTPPEERFIDISIVAAGDIMVHSTQFKSAYDGGTDSYDFKPVFEEVRPFIEKGDLSIANLETTLAGPSIPYAGYPQFNSPDEIVDALSYSGFDTIVTTNNHSLDTRAEGLQRTVQIIRDKGLDPVGTYDGQEETRILIKDVQGIKVAILAYTEHLNGLGAQYPDDELHSMVNIIEEERIISDIKQAKELNPDLILTYMHWGTEYAETTNDFQNEYAKLLVREGVDIILGSHPHVIQSSEFLEVDGNKAFVAYSLGNFVSNQRRETLGEGFEPTEDGVILHLDIQKDLETNETTIEGVDFIPTWVYRNQYEGDTQYTYRILPIQPTLDDLNYSEEYTHRMRNSYEETFSRIE